MATLSELLDQTAQDLNDPAPEHKTWKRAQLLAYWNDAKCVIFSLAPQSFTPNISVFPLAPGVYQVAHCGTLLQVLDQTDKDGNSLGNALSSGATAYAGVYTGKICVTNSEPGDKFRLSGAQITAQRGNLFTVTPSIPAHGKYFVRVLCAHPGADLHDEKSSIGDLDCGYLAAARQWVRYRALSVDDASVASLSGAQLALGTFKELMSMRYGHEMAQRLNTLALK